MTFRIGRLGFRGFLASIKDPVWWTTDASGTRVNTWFGIQSGVVSTGNSIGGKFAGVVIGPLYLAVCLLNKEDKR